ncbi:MAG: hypothetical protein OEU52_15320 [Xanthomonadales bacterium]|jgi:hypothetical protein|nr:hypothetical protein [Gammaproteobacteria bacterium]MDH3901918.1 hypothetical protein [Xanthomonadales bacterium]MDH4002620.1 hypothetical protein [Xanthomonadales bacterium]
MRIAVDLNGPHAGEDLIEVKDIPKNSVIPFEPYGVESAILNAPRAD